METIRYEVFFMEAIGDKFGCGRSCGVFYRDDEEDALSHFKNYCGGPLPLMLDSFDKMLAFWLPDKGFCRVLN